MIMRLTSNPPYFPSVFSEYQGCDDVVAVGESLLFFDHGELLARLTLIFRGLGSNKFQRTDEIRTVPLSRIKRPMVYRVDDGQVVAVVP